MSKELETTGQRGSATVVLALLAVLASGCQRENVTHVRVAKSAEGAPQAMRARAGPFMRGGGAMSAPGSGSASAPGSESAQPEEQPSAQPSDADPMRAAADQVEPPPPPDEASALQWKLPPGWSAKRETGMRYATLDAGPSSKVDVSVVVLPGVAGGELANVNRWRGQLGLAPIDDAQLAALRKPMSTDAGALELFDLVGAAGDGKERSRMLAAVLATESGSTWFLKMTGGAEAVAKKQPEFLRLLASLHFGAVADGAGSRQ